MLGRGRLVGAAVVVMVGVLGACGPDSVERELEPRTTPDAALELKRGQVMLERNSRNYANVRRATVDVVLAGHDPGTDQEADGFALMRTVIEEDRVTDHWAATLEGSDGTLSVGFDEDDLYLGLEVEDQEGSCSIAVPDGKAPDDVLIPTFHDDAGELLVGTMLASGTVRSWGPMDEGPGTSGRYELTVDLDVAAVARALLPTAATVELGDVGSTQATVGVYGQALGYAEIDVLPAVEALIDHDAETFGALEDLLDVSPMAYVELTSSDEELLVERPDEVCAAGEVPVLPELSTPV